jgi:hypothetical protein
LIALFGLLAACGRLGFDTESHPVGIEPDPEGPEVPLPGDGDGDDGTPGDGDGDGDLDGGLPGDGDGDGDGGVLPMDDGGPGPGDDASMPEPDAGGGATGPYNTQPAPIDCASYTGLIACDDFEGGTSGGTVTQTEENGTLELDQGLIVAHTSGPSSRAVLESRFSAITSGELYLRFSLYIPSTVVLRGLNVGCIGDLDDFADFGVDLDFEANDNMELYVTGDNSVHAATHAVPRDRWMCVLFKMESISGTNGHVRVFIDDQEAMDVQGIDTLPPAGVRGASAGIDWTYGGQGDTTLYIKNFLVTRDHPGNCP